MKRTGIRAKLVRAFAIQVAIISVGTIVGIYITNTIIYDVVMRQALDSEAEHFWSRFQQHSDHPLPDVYNMRGYMAWDGDLSLVPKAFRDLQPGGYHDLSRNGGDAVVHVSERDGNRLFLVFERAQVSELAFYFGIIPLAVVLLLIYGLSFVTYRLSQRAVSPIVRLARYLEDFDFESAPRVSLDLSSLRGSADAEVMSMIQAVDQFTNRLNAFIDRERVFTRDAGHELRTPVAVFKGSLDLLEENQDRPASEIKALARMRRTVEDMESLLETLLLLAREEQLDTRLEHVNVNEVVGDQLEQVRPVADRAGNSLALHELAEVNVLAPPKVLEIVIGNLIRNAVSYTQNGAIDVTVQPERVRIADTGIGMSHEQLDNAFEPFYRADESRGMTRGHGLGLSIVKRLVHQTGWSIAAYSKPGEGTAVEVNFAPHDGPQGLAS